MLLTDRVLFIDAEAIVIDKPAGLAVDAPRDGALSVDAHRSSLAFGFHRWPTMVHRLDRDTSGCLLLARTERAHRRFSAAFEAGTVEKTYLAVIDGVPEPIEGRIDLPLSKVSTKATGWRMVADAKGKPAATRWRALAVRNGQALVEFRPETGRTHQLRVHAATGLGIPIVGDPVYGRVERTMMLHAASLVVPREGKPAISAEAPPPPHFGLWIAAIKEFA